MKKLLFVLLLSGCAGSLKFGSDGASFTPDATTTKNIQALAQGVTTLDASIKAIGEAFNKLNARVAALEPVKKEPLKK